VRGVCFGQIDPDIVARWGRKIAQQSHGRQRFRRPPGTRERFGKADAVVDVVREEAEQRAVAIDRFDPVLGHLVVAPLHQQPVFARESLRQLHCPCSVFLRLPVVPE